MYLINYELHFKNISTNWVLHTATDSNIEASQYFYLMLWHLIKHQYQYLTLSCHTCIKSTASLASLWKKSGGKSLSGGRERPYPRGSNATSVNRRLSSCSSWGAKSVWALPVHTGRGKQCDSCSARIHYHTNICAVIVN